MNRLRQADALHKAGDLNGATAIYRKLLATRPTHPHVLRLLGLAQCRLGNYLLGSELLERSLAALPAQPAVHFSLGLAWRAMGRLAKALDAYSSAIALQPDFAEAHFNKGNVLGLLNRREDALACYDRAIELKPDFAQAHQNRAVALHELCRFDEALAAYDHALTVLPEQADLAEMHFNRGEVLGTQMSRDEEALAAYDRALALNPAFPAALHSRAHALQRLKRLEEASACFEDLAARINPQPNWLQGARLHLQMRLSRWHDLPQRLVELEAAVLRGECATAPFAALSVLESPALQQRVAALYAQAMFRGAASAAPAASAVSVRGAGRDRIRVAYVSADFGPHPLTRLIVELLECHDRRRFEIVAIALTAREDDPWRARVRSAVDRFVDVSRHRDDEITRLAADLEIDIAVDLNGYTMLARPELFARRLAPVQVSYLGYLGTMGAGFMDYLIADRTTVPGNLEKHYAEKIVRLPTYQCNRRWTPMPESTLTRAEAGLPEAGFVYCSFNDNYKITPEVFAAWMRILRQVPGSVLWLVASNKTARQNLRQEASSQGIDPKRLVFAPPLNFEEHLDRQRVADLFLDTYPYCGGSTASDALRVGLPVLTRTGDSFASRMGASIVRAAGLPELVTSSLEEYEGMAVRLGRQAELANALRTRLTEQLPGCELFDPQRFARNLEVAYEAMNERSTRGLAPDHIVVGPSRCCLAS